MTETKFIIVKDRVTGFLRHYKSDWLSHETIARDNDYDYREIIEAGIFIEGKLFIFDCIDSNHKDKKFNNLIDNRLNYYSNSWIKAREAESLSMYKYTGLKEGD